MHILSFSDRADPEIGPATLSPQDFRELFTDGWTVLTTRRVTIAAHVASDLGDIPGLLVTVTPS